MIPPDQICIGGIPPEESSNAEGSFPDYVSDETTPQSPEDFDSLLKKLPSTQDVNDFVVPAGRLDVPVADGNPDGQIPDEKSDGPSFSSGPVSVGVDSENSSSQSNHTTPVNEQTPLLYIQGGSWTIEDAFQGTHIFGATGSGKTSGSGQEIALSMLEAGMGGLVLTVKADEAALWSRYCAYTKREVIVFGPRVTPETPYSFNFLEYERRCVAESVRRQYPNTDPAELDGVISAFLTENLVNLFSAIIEVSQRGSGSGAKNEAFWQNAVRQLLRNTLDLLIIAGEKLTFAAIYDVILNAPKGKAASDAFVNNGLEDEQDSVFARSIRFLGNLPSAHPRYADCHLILAYWLQSFAELHHETRSTIESTFMVVADPFMRGTLRHLFSPEDDSPQLYPDMIREGAVVVLSLPVKEFFELGQFAQVLYKYIFQRSMERSSGNPATLRPVFLWVDEAQFFLTSNDMLFQTTARSAKVATVFLTQNISSYYALMPGDEGRARTNSLMGNFVTKIFHSNSDSVTNLWASELIAKTRQYRRSIQSTENFNPPGDNTRGNFWSKFLLGSGKRSSSSINVSQSEQEHYQIPPIAFSVLKSGGRRNGLIVEGVFLQGGRTTPDGVNHQKLGFHQQRI